MKKKCLVKKYDTKIKEPPFKFINLGEFEFDEPVNDEGGVKRANILYKKCKELGFRFKFYSLSDKDGYDYKVTVRGD